MADGVLVTQNSADDTFSKLEGAELTILTFGVTLGLDFFKV